MLASTVCVLLRTLELREDRVAAPVLFPAPRNQNGHKGGSNFKGTWCCVVFVNPTKLKCSGKREPQPRNCLPLMGLRVSMSVGAFSRLLIVVEGHSPLWAAISLGS